MNAVIETPNTNSTVTPASSGPHTSDQELSSTSSTSDRTAERRRLANSVVQTKNEVSGGIRGGLEDFFRKIAHMPDINRQTVEKALKGSHDNPQKTEDRFQSDQDHQPRPKTTP